MARRANPKRIAIARRAGQRSRLIVEGKLSEEKADYWLEAWEAEGRLPVRVSASYWNAL